MLEFEYFWSIILLFIMDRICTLHDQFEKDLLLLPEPRRSDDSFTLSLEDLTNSRDSALRISFLRLCQLMRVTMIVSLMYLCNVSVWFVMTDRTAARNQKIYNVPFKLL